MEVVETPYPVPWLPSHGMEMGPIWGFPLETRGRSRRSGSVDVCGEMVSERRMRRITERNNFFCIYFPSP